MTDCSYTGFERTAKASAVKRLDLGTMLGCRAVCFHVHQCQNIPAHCSDMPRIVTVIVTTYVQTAADCMKTVTEECARVVNSKKAEIGTRTRLREGRIRTALWKAGNRFGLSRNQVPAVQADLQILRDQT